MKNFFIKFLYHFLAFCARKYIKKTQPVIIGITGSVGKTSARMVIYEMLNKFMKTEIVYTSPKNYNSELGIILSIFTIEDYDPSIKSILGLCVSIFTQSLFAEKKYDVIILEYGIDHPGDMEFLVSVAQPDISVFTKLDYTHSEFFGTKREIGEEKFKMIHATKVKTYLNYEDKFCREESVNVGIDIEFYMQKNDVKKYNIVYKDDKFVTTFETNNKEISSNIIGKTNAHYVGLSLKILEKLGGLPKKKAFNLKFENQAGRFNIFKGKNKSILVDSSYNAGPESMKKAIEDMFYLRNNLFPKYKVGFVLGDMRELGDASEKQHKKIFELATKGDFIISIGPETKKYFSEQAKQISYKGKFKTYLNARKVGLKIQKFLEKEEGKNKYIILFKGSQNTIFVEEAIRDNLKNSEDQNNLPRQEEYWLKAKNYFFKTLK